MNLIERCNKLRGAPPEPSAILHLSVEHLPTVTSSCIDEVIRGYVPARRFAQVSFESYVPDDRYPSQRAARDHLREFATRIGQSQRAHVLRRLIRSQQNTGPRAIYLDGGYGVGKTHLLAATYHAVGDQRLYLSFSELAYTISRLGLDATLEAMRDTRLVCIDEFELDDVAQTRMAAAFLRRAQERRGTPMSVVTTSNTLPSDLGQGRFAADAFQREIGEIAAWFEILTVDGEDYRHRRWDELAMGLPDVDDSASVCRAYAADSAPEDARALLDADRLLRELAAVHPVHYPQIARQLDALFVQNLERIDDQAVALRLVHFVDKLYDQEVRLMVSTREGLSLGEMFSATYRHGGYEKKYRRCLSRLHELVAETRAANGALETRS
jgi:cell division protein ZapE